MILLFNLPWQHFKAYSHGRVHLYKIIIDANVNTVVNSYSTNKDMKQNERQIQLCTTLKMGSTIPCMIKFMYNVFVYNDCNSYIDNYNTTKSHKIHKIHFSLTCNNILMDRYWRYIKLLHNNGNHYNISRCDVFGRIFNIFGKIFENDSMIVKDSVRYGMWSPKKNPHFVFYYKVETWTPIAKFKLILKYCFYQKLGNIWF